jgi:hypothetical protein
MLCLDGGEWGGGGGVEGRGGERFNELFERFFKWEREGIEGIRTPLNLFFFFLFNSPNWDHLEGNGSTYVKEI